MKFHQILVLSLLGAGLIIYLVRHGGVLFSHGKSTLRFGINNKNMKELLYLISKVMEHTMSVAKIEIKEIIEQQMRKAEEQLSIVRDRLRREFVKLLQSHDVDSPATHDDYVYFSVLIKNLHSDFLDTIRIWFVQNCFDKKTEKQMIDYTQDKIMVLDGKVSEFLDQMWNAKHRLITREDLFQVFKVGEKGYDTYVQCINELFTEARRIAIERKLEVHKLKTELDTYIESLLGMKLHPEEAGETPQGC